MYKYWGVGDKGRKKEKCTYKYNDKPIHVLIQEKIMLYLKQPIHILETELSIGQFKSACSNLCQDRC